MSIVDLSEAERHIALQCLIFVSEGSEFDAAELTSRLGLNMSELASVVNSWPDIEDEISSSVGHVALNNCFNEVCNGLSFSVEKWHKWFSVSRSAVCETYAHWLQSVSIDTITEE